MDSDELNLKRREYRLEIWNKSAMPRAALRSFNIARDCYGAQSRPRAHALTRSA